jgi:putative methyltransferase (TIGR04325 family)
LLVDLIRRLSPYRQPPFTWEGIYPHLSDVPTENGTYNCDDRIAEFLEHTGSMLALVCAGEKPDPGWHGEVGLLASVISASRSKVRVLDYGGGLGLAFIQLLATVHGNAAIEYHVVELEKACTAGRQLFADDSRIHFHTSLPSLRDGVDIVYASSVLPYMEDYAELLRQLAALNAPYMLLTQLAAGNFPSYATKQLNLGGQILPYWFLNLEEVIGIVTASGYKLVYEGQAGPEYDQSNFPKTHRIGRMLTLLFVRAS